MVQPQPESFGSLVRQMAANGRTVREIAWLTRRSWRSVLQYLVTNDLPIHELISAKEEQAIQQLAFLDGLSTRHISNCLQLSMQRVYLACEKVAQPNTKRPSRQELLSQVAKRETEAYLLRLIAEYPTWSNQQLLEIIPNPTPSTRRVLNALRLTHPIRPPDPRTSPSLVLPTKHNPGGQPPLTWDQDVVQNRHLLYLWDQNLPATAIAEKLGCSAQNVRKKALRIKQRHGRCQRQCIRSRTHSKYIEWREWWAAGDDAHAIAQRTGITLYRVQRRIYWARIKYGWFPHR